MNAPDTGADVGHTADAAEALIQLAGNGYASLPMSGPRCGGWPLW
jgi:hypothetical protein